MIYLSAQCPTHGETTLAAGGTGSWFRVVWLMLQQLIVAYIGVKDTECLTSLSPDLVSQKLSINRGKEGQEAPRGSWSGVEKPHGQKDLGTAAHWFQWDFDVIDQCHRCKVWG